MSIMKKISLCLFLCLLFFSSSFGQVNVEKETIYISYDKSKKKDKIGTKERVRFILDSESFLYQATKNCKTKIAFNQIKDSLVTIQQAKQKANEYLERVVEEWKKQAQNKSKKITEFIKNTEIPYYNRYFNKIYIFEKLNKKKGILYEVKWESFIE